MREVTARADAGDEDARLAIAVFGYRIRKYVGAYLAVLGRCDALVFTGGIGQHSAVVRARACAGLEGLGIVIDAERNGRGASVVSSERSPGGRAGDRRPTRSGRSPSKRPPCWVAPDPSECFRPSECLPPGIRARGTPTAGGARGSAGSRTAASECHLRGVRAGGTPTAGDTRIG